MADYKSRGSDHDWMYHRGQTQLWWCCCSPPRLSLTFSMMLKATPVLVPWLTCVFKELQNLQLLHMRICMVKTRECPGEQHLSGPRYVGIKDCLWIVATSGVVVAWINTGAYLLLHCIVNPVSSGIYYCNEVTCVKSGAWVLFQCIANPVFLVFTIVMRSPESIQGLDNYSIEESIQFLLVFTMAMRSPVRGLFFSIA